jgi:uncharacterized membrane protein
MTSEQKRRGRPPGPKSSSAEPASRNITLNKEEADALNDFQNRLEKHVGFRPNLSQTVRWLITHSGALLKEQT